jgi:hypothetical protein
MANRSRGKQTSFMKRIGHLVSAAAAAAILLATAGCDSIRDYSVNSYQGVLPMSDFRPSGTVPTTLTADSPKPSTPPSTPAASSPAAGNSAGEPTKPASDSSK